MLISLHGDRDVQNRLAGHKLAYDRAMTAMRNARAAGIHVVAEATLVQDNVHGIVSIMKAIDELRRDGHPDLRVGWPCGQKFCTSDDDLPLTPGNPTR
jgi:MoaA/NifB/PqqE/SkfB family radical SAM enzyme